MQRYGQELGIPEGISSNIEGAFQLPITDELTIVAKSLSPSMDFSCNLGEFSLDRESTFLQKLMVANLFGISTRGAVLGLAPDGKTVFLSQEFPENPSYLAFMESFDDFCNVVEYWRDHVKGRV